MDLRGRTALVSGAAGGIGRATALTFARRGAARIVLVDIDGAALQTTAQLVEAEGAEAVARTVDVADGAALERLFADAEADGGLDIVFNNAGIVSGPPSFPDTGLARIRLLIAINYTAVVEATWHAIHMMRRAGKGGVIINTASIGALEPGVSEPPYASSKAGVLMFSRACGPLARSDGIRVNAICPGIVDTGILASTGNGAPTAWLAERLKQIELLQPGQIADAVVALVEDDDRSGDYVVIDNPPRQAATQEG